MKIVVLHDQVSETSREDERDALVQAEAVSDALRNLGHEPVTMAFEPDLPRSVNRLLQAEPDLVFNLVESLGGSGRLIHVPPCILDSLEIPFTGASSEAVLNTSNKILAKKILKGHGIPTPHSLQVSRFSKREHFIPARYILKSTWEHASVGIDDSSVVCPASLAELETLLEGKKNIWGGEWFAEAFVEGREFNLSLIGTSSGPRVLPPAEMVFENFPPDRPKVVGYSAKWHPDTADYVGTVRRFTFSEGDLSLLNRLQDLAVACWNAFSLRGHARVDFRVDEIGSPWVLEVNANPCLSPDAGFAAALERAGIPFREAIRFIIEDTEIQSRSATGR